MDDLLEEVGFARDSPLEGEGFEPSVPRNRAEAFFGTAQFDLSVTSATARAAPSLGTEKQPTGRYSRPRICCSIAASTRAAAAQAASFGCIWSPQSYSRR